jgi:hypothetical protein
MKFRKILFSLFTISITAAAAVTTLSSCAGVSKDILDNLVNRGKGDKLSSDITFQNSLEMALTDKDASSAMKKTVVSEYLLK